MFGSIDIRITLAKQILTRRLTPMSSEKK